MLEIRQHGLGSVITCHRDALNCTEQSTPLTVTVTIFVIVVAFGYSLASTDILSPHDGLNALVGGWQRTLSSMWMWMWRS
jgi:hypothetical protein